MTPEQEEQVRRALASAAGRDPDAEPGTPVRPDAATPPEVVDRLDRVLGELTAARRTPAEAGSSVTRLSRARADQRLRRRGRARDLLVAAAAVSVIALAGGTVANGGLGVLVGGGSGETASSSAEAGGSAGGAGDSGDSGGSDAGGGAPGGAPVPSLTRATLRRDVQRLVDASPTDPSVDSGCAAPPSATGDLLREVRLDGRPATLVLGPVQDRRRAARVYSCATAEPLGRTTVVAR